MVPGAGYRSLGFSPGAHCTRPLKASVVVKDGAEQECSGYVCDRGVVTELVLGGPGRGIEYRERDVGGLKPTLRKDTAEWRRAEAHPTERHSRMHAG